MLLTYGQPKYRLFLLCEGNGDGTGVHFLDYSKHKGYRLETPAAAAVINESVELLRFTFQVSVLFAISIPKIIKIQDKIPHLVEKHTVSWDTRAVEEHLSK